MNKAFIHRNSLSSINVANRVWNPRATSRSEFHFGHLPGNHQLDGLITRLRANADYNRHLIRDHSMAIIWTPPNTLAFTNISVEASRVENPSINPKPQIIVTFQNSAHHDESGGSGGPNQLLVDALCLATPE